MQQKGSQRNQEEFWVEQRKNKSYLMMVTYEGTGYLGFQIQTHSRKQRTVAGDLTKMLTTMLQVEASSLSLGVRLLHCCCTTLFVGAWKHLFCDSCVLEQCWTNTYLLQHADRCMCLSLHHLPAKEP